MVLKDPRLRLLHQTTALMPTETRMTTADPPLPQRISPPSAGSTARGCRLVHEYLDGGGDVEGLFVDILMPAMILTGEEWEADRISVATSITSARSPAT